MRNSFQGTRSSARMSLADPESRATRRSPSGASWLTQCLHMGLLAGTCHINHEVYDEISQTCGLHAGRTDQR